MILKSKIITFQEQVTHSDNNKHNYVWHTFKKGQSVPNHLVDMAKLQGAEFELIDEIVEKVSKPKKETIKQKVKKVFNKK